MPKSSPFETVHKQLGARMADYHGWLLPTDFGCPQAERTALNDNCAAFDLCGFGRISVKGPAAERLLTAIMPKNSPKIQDGRWAWTNPGKDIIAKVGRLGEEFFVFSMPQSAGVVLQMLRQKTQEFAGAAITDLSEKTALLGLYGPSAYDVLTRLLPVEDFNIEPGEISRISVMMFSFTLLGGSWLNGDGLELLCPNSLAPLAATAIAKYHKKHNITAAGMECLMNALDDKV